MDHTHEEGTRLDPLFQDDFELVAFRDLPEPHRMAIANYMAVRGEAWETKGTPLEGFRYDDPKNWDLVRQSLPDFARRYGRTVFGVAMIGTQSMLEAIVDDEATRDSGGDLASVVEGHGGGAGSYEVEGPSDRVPVILSSNDSETLQDGWERLHAYTGERHSTIPAVFFPDERHFQMANEMKTSAPVRSALRP